MGIADPPKGHWRKPLINSIQVPRFPHRAAPVDPVQGQRDFQGEALIASLAAWGLECSFSHPIWWWPWWRFVGIRCATRVMHKPGLACPTGRLCYGSFLPGGQMNLKGVPRNGFTALIAFLGRHRLLVLLVISFAEAVPRCLLAAIGPAARPFCWWLSRAPSVPDA